MQQCARMIILCKLLTWSSGAVCSAFGICCTSCCFSLTSVTFHVCIKLGCLGSKRFKGMRMYLFQWWGAAVAARTNNFKTRRMKADKADGKQGGLKKKGNKNEVGWNRRNKIRKKKVAEEETKKERERRIKTKQNHSIDFVLLICLELLSLIVPPWTVKKQAKKRRECLISLSLLCIFGEVVTRIKYENRKMIKENLLAGPLAVEWRDV